MAGGAAWRSNTLRRRHAVTASHRRRRRRGVTNASNFGRWRCRPTTSGGGDVGCREGGSRRAMFKGIRLGRLGVDAGEQRAFERRGGAARIGAVRQGGAGCQGSAGARSRCNSESAWGVAHDLGYRQQSSRGTYFFWADRVRNFRIRKFGARDDGRRRRAKLV